MLPRCLCLHVRSQFLSRENRRNSLSTRVQGAMLLGYSPVAQGVMGTLFTWLVTALGSGVVFFADWCSSEALQQKFLDGSLGFAAGVMLAASYWSLLKPAIEMSESAGYVRRCSACERFVRAAAAPLKPHSTRRASGRLSRQWSGSSSAHYSSMQGTLYCTEWVKNCNAPVFPPQCSNSDTPVCSLLLRPQAQTSWITQQT